METEGRNNERGGQEPGTNSNVVPFPRDWLGPREELIPFGPSADRPPEIDAFAPEAEAFWGGEAGPMHAVLASPPPSPSASPGPEPTMATGGALRGSHARGLAAGGLVAALLAAAVFGRLAGVPTGGSGPAVGSDVAAAGFVDLALLRGAVGTPAIEAPKRHKTVPRRRQPAAHPRPHRARPGVTSRSSAATVSDSATSQSTTSTTSSTTSSATVSSGTRSTVASQPAATSTSPAHSSVSSHTANVRSGPVGPGAPFGPGQLK